MIEVTESAIIEQRWYYDCRMCGQMSGLYRFRWVAAFWGFVHRWAGC